MNFLFFSSCLGVSLSKETPTQRPASRFLAKRLSQTTSASPVWQFLAFFERVKPRRRNKRVKIRKQPRRGTKDTLQFHHSFSNISPCVHFEESFHGIFETLRHLLEKLDFPLARPFYELGTGLRNLVQIRFSYCGTRGHGDAFLFGNVRVGRERASVVVLRDTSCKNLKK